MSEAWQYFIVTLIVYFAANTIACWSLNFQFGTTGVMNFAFIIFQALGAYVTGVLTLGPSSATGFEHYIGGWNLPWPLPLLIAGVFGAGAALLIGWFALRPRRVDFQAVLLLVASIAATTVVVTQTGLLNGSAGLADVPAPFRSFIGGTEADYGWFFAAVSVAIAVAVYLLVIRRIDKSPWASVLRSVRENPDAAAALGTNVDRERLKVFMIGGALAALSGGVLIEFISAWAPGGWTYPETFIYFVAIVVGGLGNSVGAVVGSAVVLTGILESVQVLPSFGVSGFSNAMQWVGIGALIIVFLWFAPRGLFPERRRTWAREVRVIDRQPAVAVTVTDGDGEGGPPVRAPLEVAPAAGAEPQGPRGDILAVDDVRKSFGGLQALAGATLSIEEGTIVALIGPNGAGKTTLLNVVAGAISPSSGRVLLRGKDVTGLPAHKMAQLGVMRTFQHVGEFGRLTVAENLVLGGRRGVADTLAGSMLGRRSWGKPQEERLARARRLLGDLELLHLWDSYMGQLSGGQKRIVEIVRCLMRDPALLLLDEPFAGLSPTIVAEIEVYLARLRAEGRTVVLVEHQLSVVERLADSVVMMADGRVLGTGTMEELRRRKDVVDAYLVS
jgi:branched-chain amino acid transport system permease protein